MTTQPDWQRPLRGLKTLMRGWSPIRRIQVYGMRCSGTHAIIKLIEANFGDAAFTEAYGFKHWQVPPQILFQPDVLVLVIAREPADWLRSLHRQPWHVDPTLRALSFAEFIRAEWHSIWDEQFWGVDHTHPVFGTEMLHERDQQTGLRYPDPVTMRTATLRHWSELHRRAHNVALLDYEAVKTMPEVVLHALSEATGLPMKDAGYRPLPSYKGLGVKPYVETTYPPLCAEDAAHVASRLDARVEALFGMEGVAVDEAATRAV